MHSFYLYINITLQPSNLSQNGATFLHTSPIRNHHQHPLNTPSSRHRNQQVCCKSWLHLLQTDYFINSHLSKSSPTLAVFHQDRWLPSYKIYEFKDDPNHYNPITTFKLPFPGMMHGSNNGLLFLRDYTVRHSRFFICNPITREYAEIQTPLHYTYPQVATFGFGASRRTRKHKVVRVFHDCLRDQDTHELLGIPKSECHVYTLGTGSWISITASAPFEYSCRSYGALLHGNLHWLVYDLNGKPWISCLDLETELFSIISPPSSFVDRPGFVCDVFALSDFLCLCCNFSSENEIVIWLMMEYGDEKSWRRKYVIKNSGDFVGEFYDVARPIKVFEDGDVLMAWGDSTLFYSSRENGTITETGMFGCGNVDSILHTSSFLSLYSFGMENVISF